MSYWAYCEDLSTDVITIGDAEAHHLLHVLRLAPGAELTAFDGRGTEAHVVVLKTTRRDVSCQVVSRVSQDVRGRPSITVFAAPPKGDRLKWMVEKLTEIGVDRLVLLNTQRTVVTPGETRVEKLQANVIAACKQCRRSLLMQVEPLQSFKAGLPLAIEAPTQHSVFIAHPTGPHHSSARVAVPQTTNLAVFIGPEGGFTDEEVQFALQTGAIPISWPGTVLRIETAAVVFATMLMRLRDESSQVS